MAPPNLGFSSVAVRGGSYTCTFKNVGMTVSDNMACYLNIAVVTNKSNKFCLVGNDLIGGAYPRWIKVSYNDPLGFIVL